MIITGSDSDTLHIDTAAFEDGVVFLSSPEKMNCCHSVERMLDEYERDTQFVWCPYCGGVADDPKYRR